MRNHFLLLTISVISIYYLSNCANVQAPTGGDKDTIPPSVVETYPKQNTINFTQKEISIEFDEYIKSPKFQETLIISPSVKGRFEFDIFKNKIEIIFEENLAPNTTYTINLSNAIEDITESNKNPNILLTFSTGSVIDSLYITGKVTDLYINTKIDNAYVGLYDATDTLNHFNSKPLYLDRTNKNGAFKINNIKAGKYKLVTIKDTDGNYYYSNPGEIIGFQEDTINLTNSIDSISISATKYNLRPLTVKKITQEETRFKVEFNKTADTLKINVLNKPHQKLDYAIDAKQLTIYNTQYLKDTLPLFVYATDSAGLILEDTIDLFFKYPEVEEQKKKDKPRRKKDEADTIPEPPVYLTLDIKPSGGNTITKDSKITISTDRPIVKYDSNKIYFFTDSLTQFKIKESDIKFSKANTTFTIEKKLPAKDTFGLAINLGAIQSYDSLTNDTIQTNYTFKDPSQFGTITGTVNSSYNSYIIQLIDASGKVIAEVKNAKAYIFNFLDPATYKIRMLIDENENGVWEPGNLRLNKEPEKVLFHPKEITIKANWDIEENLSLLKVVDKTLDK